MTFQKTILSFLLILGFTFSAYAQNSIGFNLGLSSYEGDIHCFDEEDLNLINSSGLTFGLQGRKSLNNYLSARLAYQFARIQGDDLGFSQESGHQTRKFNFQNNLHEITLRLDLEPWKQKIVSPFLSVGAGVAFNNPNTFFDYENKTTSFKSLIDQDRDELSRAILALPISAGLNFRVTDLITLGTEFGIRYATSDYLDGVSMAASTNYNDWFGTGALTLNYTLGGGMNTKMKTPKVKMDKADIDGQIRNEQQKGADGGMMEEVPVKVEEEIVIEEPVIVEEPKVTTEPRSNTDKQENNTKTTEVVEAVTPIVELDSDGDGIVDKNDTCPNVYAKTSNGCPEVNKDIDTDGDGFIDSNDNCPRLYSKVNNGCPEEVINSDVDCEAAFGKRSVNFQTSFSELTIKDKETLNSVVAILTACPSMMVKLEGHTDSRGSNLTNQDLSDTRARAVKSYLMRNGIETNRVKASGYGETQSIGDNGTASGRAKNRRVEIIFF